jgi:hypothetical protein
LGLKKDRPKTRPLIQVEHGLEGEEENMPSRKKFVAGNSRTVKRENRILVKWSGLAEIT